MDIGHIAGLSASLIKGGEVRWIGTYGTANFELEIPVDTSTIFMIASISKTITVTALMQLWEKDSFELDDDINDYLPFDVRNPNFPDDPITFRMLCTHSSSIKDNWSILFEYINMDPLIPLGEYLFNYLDPSGSYYNQNLNFYNEAPGSNYHYCNVSTALIGYLTEVIGDDPFFDQTNDRIFDPLQMDQTTWFYSELDTMNAAMTYHWNGSSYVPEGFISGVDYPAGDLKTSVDQLSKFLLSYMNGGTYMGVEILESATVDSILSLQIPSIEPTQGLIWRKGVLGDGRTIWGHSGSWYGIMTGMWFCPDDSTAVNLFANCNNWTIGSKIFNYLFDYVRDSINVTTVPVFKAVQSDILINTWPNPVSDVLTIEYYLDRPSFITINIFNNFGRLEDQISLKQHEGKNETIWNAERLPAGIYYIQLKTDYGTMTKKMIKI
jgi:CubicO group peptidase (beta-lactamase class C family)